MKKVIVFCVLLVQFLEISDFRKVEELPIYSDIEDVECVSEYNHIYFGEFILSSDLSSYPQLKGEYTLVRCNIRINQTGDYRIDRMMFSEQDSEGEPRQGKINFIIHWNGRDQKYETSLIESEEDQERYLKFFEEQINDIVKLIEKIGIDFFVSKENFEPEISKHDILFFYLLKNEKKE